MCVQALLGIPAPGPAAAAAGERDSISEAAKAAHAAVAAAGGDMAPVREPTSPAAPLLPPSREAPAAVHQTAGATSSPTPSPAGLSQAVEPSLKAKADAAGDADALVVLGAQYSARQQYVSALYCLQRAVEQDPSHVRAHYSMGQISAMVGNHEAAEIAYMRCLQVVQQPEQRGQALYCLGSTQHSQVGIRIGNFKMLLACAVKYQCCITPQSSMVYVDCAALLRKLI